MKKITLIVIVLGVVLGGIALNNKAVEYVQREVMVEVTPEWAKDEEAVKAAQAVIRRKELEAELATLTTEIEARETRVTEIEKELGTY